VTQPSTPSGGQGDARALPPSAYVRMSHVLRAGLLAAIAVLATGIVAYVAKYPNQTSGGVLGANPILQYLSLSGLVNGIAQGHVEAYLTLGLIVLVATPLLRVASGFYYFQVGRERTMAAVTITVLALLLFGILVLGPALR
jgi:uncharacterized membrane protein